MVVVVVVFVEVQLLVSIVNVDFDYFSYLDCMGQKSPSSLNTTAKVANAPMSIWSFGSSTRIPFPLSTAVLMLEPMDEPFYAFKDTGDGTIVSCGSKD
ncbi:hypothetical protein VNO78_10471 [Psophocarpus tetragonolobus]|uniref:Uncharacterized protein n=1 Tax=Psophocarpus tetragonolobus TaxID=3891 RepID=A0AAN9SJU1_PSOTE